ncbi:PEP-CTERM protein-sorting domain-containing protein [Duganella sp. CF402]|uniref:FxDxF family PEP-CTERM protein n=1 Tax=unclassified Duganella TaxID=2636909 RepID=UPI0008BE9F24|nr:MULTISPECIES: FxDxF family PEP-CTERM protein [unclassified Duganella]RZT09375.1 putative secreted protein with PEP-CTERM sorting signal [Duganella sp. BK701]SEL59746.1 PEP-CTERM protein-sorting domain-containing protein [Duganella sp. CF402]
MKKLLSTLAAGAALGFVSVAQAAPVTTTLEVSSNVINNIKGTSGALDFAQFDSSLGTLLSVEVELYSDLNSTFAVENKGTRGTTFTLSSKSKVTMTSGGLFTIDAVENNYSNSVLATAYDHVLDHGGSSGATITVTDQHGAPTTVLLTDAGALAAFTGNSVVHTTVAGVGTTKVTASGNIDTIASSSYSAYGKVTYTYALPVPEPETYAMLLAGLGLVGAIARRRKSA